MTQAAATTVAEQTGDTTAATAASETTASSGTADLAAAAADEEMVMIYSNQAIGILDALEAGFEAEYPDVNLEYYRAVDADLQSRVEIEHSSGDATADIYIGSDTTFSHAKGEEGWWAAPTGPNFTGSGEADASRAIAEGNDFEIGAAVLTFAWNTELVSTPINDYEDLLAPELGNGQIGVVEPTAAPPVDFYLWLEENFGEEYVAQLAAQNPRIYPSALPMAEALGAGEIAATPWAPPSILVPAQEAGSPVEFGLSEAGAWGTRYWAGILDNAPHAKRSAAFRQLPHGTGGPTVVCAERVLLPGRRGRRLHVEQARFASRSHSTRQPSPRIRNGGTRCSDSSTTTS